jgi:hypothetical protein
VHPYEDEYLTAPSQALSVTVLTPVRLNLPAG